MAHIDQGHAPPSTPNCNDLKTKLVIVNETRIIDRLIRIFRISHITTLRPFVTKPLMLSLNYRIRPLREQSFIDFNLKPSPTKQD